MLEIKNLQVEFKNQKVLHGVELSLQEGSIVGILGKNGAGTLHSQEISAGKVNP